MTGLKFWKKGDLLHLKVKSMGGYKNYRYQSFQVVNWKDLPNEGHAKVYSKYLCKRNGVSNYMMDSLNAPRFMVCGDRSCFVKLKPIRKE